MRRFVAEHAQALLGSTPESFLVSARQALRAKLGELVGIDVAGDEFDAIWSATSPPRSTRRSGCGSS